MAVADQDPWRIAQIRELETNLQAVYAKRLAAKGETFESAGKNRPAYFQARKRLQGKGWGIDEVVEWSRTSRGGTQVELFHTSEPGCQMWGLCDIGDPTPEGDNDE